MTQNRTLQFLGYAYGNAPVSLTAQINGTTVFSGEVSTINTEIPAPPNDLSNATALFSVVDSSLFPTDFSGSYPMTLTVTGGYGIVVGDVLSNYMSNTVSSAQLDNSSINGTTLTVGSVSSGAIEIGQKLSGPGVANNTAVVSGAGSTWTVNNSQTVGPISMYAASVVPGNATGFLDCNNSSPIGDPRSNVVIDGAAQTPDRPPNGTWTWVVNNGSTLACDLTVSLGNVAS